MLSFFLVILLTQDGQIIPFDSQRWTVEGNPARFTTWQGRPAMTLKGSLAYINDTDFTNGTLEFSMGITQGRGFMGCIWRLQDGANFEEFYIRSHQSGNPDANQYTPVINGAAGWQLYHGSGYGSPVVYSYDQWFPVKLVVSGSQAEVYIGDMSKPVLFIPELKRSEKAGKVGLRVLPFNEAHFADFRFTTETAPQLKGRAEPSPEAVTGSITHWQVSDSFSEKELGNSPILPADFHKNRSWKPLKAETAGIVNLAWAGKVTRKKRTVMASFELEAAEATTVGLRFGYSDRVKLYVNGNKLYQGSNRYRSRDYRYLGTIGLFDQVFLPLKKGRNRVQLAVSEDFGGWGVIAVLDERPEVTPVIP